jgi:hypothetical protein
MEHPESFQLAPGINEVHEPHFGLPKAFWFHSVGSFMFGQKAITKPDLCQHCRREGSPGEWFAASGLNLRA